MSATDRRVHFGVSIPQGGGRSSNVVPAPQPPLGSSSVPSLSAAAGKGSTGFQRPPPRLQQQQSQQQQARGRPAGSLVILGVFFLAMVVCIWLITHTHPKLDGMTTTTGGGGGAVRSESAERQARSMKDVAGLFRPPVTTLASIPAPIATNSDGEEEVSQKVHHQGEGGEEEAAAAVVNVASHASAGQQLPSKGNHNNNIVRSNIANNNKGVDDKKDGSPRLADHHDQHYSSSSVLFGPLLPADEPSVSTIEAFISSRSLIHPYFSNYGNEDGVAAAATSSSSSAPRRAILLIPVNGAYVDFGMNLLCSLLSLRWAEDDAMKGGGVGMGVEGSDDGGEARKGGESFFDTSSKRVSWLLGDHNKGFSFVAMDKPAHDSLRSLNVPVIRDPDIPFITSKSATWADPKFHSLVCTKLIPVIRVLKLGIDVILSDADIVFMKHFVPLLRSVYFPPAAASSSPALSFLFSIGSCHKHLPNNLNMNEEKINTGFYYARADKAVINVLERALLFCRGSTLDGDQPAVNSIVKRDSEGGGGGKKGYSYGFFDGCLFSNGCTYFKHLCANNTYNSKYDRQMGSSALSNELRLMYPKDEPVMVHANFLVGKKTKVRHLEKYGLWNTKCMLDVFGYTPPVAPATTPASSPPHH